MAPLQSNPVARGGFRIEGSSSLEALTAAAEVDQLKRDGGLAIHASPEIGCRDNFILLYLYRSSMGDLRAVLLQAPCEPAARVVREFAPSNPSDSYVAKSLVGEVRCEPLCSSHFHLHGHFHIFVQNVSFPV